MSEADLRAEIASLPGALRARLDAAGFDTDRLVTLAAPLAGRARAGGAATAMDRDERNRIRGVVEPPAAGDVVDAPVPGSSHPRSAITAPRKRRTGRGEDEKG